MGFSWIPFKNYKRHYICLQCRKGFKRPSKKDMKNPENDNLSNLMDKYYASESKEDIILYVNKAHQKLKATCPNCQHQMIQVHYDFEVPPQRKDKTWAEIKERFSSKLKIEYAIYIQWHILELKKVESGSKESEMLRINLKKLDVMSNS